MAREGWKCLEIAFSLPTGKEIKGGSNWPARNFWSHPEKLAASGLDAELRPESSAIIGAGRGVGGASADRPSPTPSLPPSPRRPGGCSRPRLAGGAGSLRGVVGVRRAVSVFRLPPLLGAEWVFPGLGLARRVPAAAPSYKNKAIVRLNSWVLN